MTGRQDDIAEQVLLHQVESLLLYRTPRPRPILRRQIGQGCRCGGELLEELVVEASHPEKDPDLLDLPRSRPIGDGWRLRWSAVKMGIGGPDDVEMFFGKVLPTGT